MRNRRQTIAGPGGAPQEGSAARTTFLPPRDGIPTDVAFAHRAGVFDIGRAGRTGHFSS